MSTTTASRSASPAAAGRSTRISGESRPVLLWAVIGLICLSIGGYSVLSWLMSPYVVPSPVGDTPIPHGQLIMLRVFEITVFCAAIGGLLFKVLIPVLRGKGISWDGMVMLALLGMWWQDPLDNYVNFTFLYNAHTLNYSSWASFIPGFGYPKHTQYPEPLLLLFGLYLWFFYLPMLFGFWVMSKVKVYKPDISILGLILSCFAALFVFDILIEVACLRTGVVAYAGAIHSLTFWAGEPYQFPIYESVLMGGFYTALSCLRYFRDDKGLSFVERGVDKLSIPAPAKKLISFLALSGFVQAWYLLGYFAPYNVLATQADAFPSYPSYMRAGICGEGSEYACPDKLHVPIPRVGGQIYVRPDDPRLPPESAKSQRGEPYGFFKDS